MIKVVGIRFQKAGKIYYFDPSDFELETGMHAIVETVRGVEMGTVLIPPKEVEDEKVIQPLKPVIRVATDEDERTLERNKEKEKEAFAICKEKIAKHNLEMKLVNAEYTFDSNKLLFYFTADGRIDFRELVKDLAAVFRTRIELRQIGVRDETKILGGIGICGRPLCCKTYLSDFVPVSIKMAKEQNLSLNPTKISGVCGRLMCCLKNEQETYEYLNARLPMVGDMVQVGNGVKGEVQSVNVLRQLVKVIIDNGEEKELKEFKVDEISFRPRKRKDVKLSEEELKELEGLEDESELEEKSERKDRSNRRDNHRSERRERTENNDRSERRERTENNDRSERRERTENNDRSERRERTENNDRSERRERAENRNRNDRRNRVENTENQESQEITEQTTNKQEGNPSKKRYDGKGKRYYNRNKKRKNQSQGE